MISLIKASSRSRRGFCSPNARDQMPGRPAIIEVLVTECGNEGFLLDMDPVEKSRTYWDKDHEYAEIISEEKSKPKERKQTPRVRRMPYKAIDSLADDVMIFCNRNVHGELILQRKDGKPTNEQTTDDENETGNGKHWRSMSKVSNVLKAEYNANIDADKNGNPQHTERRFVKSSIR